MKKILVLFIIFYSTTHATFEFINYKSDGALSKEFIQKIIDEFKPDIFFETGTFAGNTTRNAAPFFKKLYTVELNYNLYQATKKKLSSYHHIHSFNEQSAETIKKVVPSVDGTIVFWLDAHYSGEGTSLSFDNPEAPEAVTAIREELKAIQETNIHNCIILIDDIRGFGIKILDQEYLGCWAYPTMQEVQTLLYKINPQFKIMLLGDILLAYDQTKYTPQFSNTVEACTQTRLYDGYNLSNEQLIAYEQKIMIAPEHEKQCIKQLYNQMTNCKDPMFWHDLWYGLAELGSHNYTHAYEALSKVKIREQSYNKNKQLDRKKILYEHYRINDYLSLAQGYLHK